MLLLLPLLLLKEQMYTINTDQINVNSINKHNHAET